MRPEAKVQRRGDRSAPDFTWLFASSAMYVASLTGMTREKRNHIRHHQPQKPTVRESRVAPRTMTAFTSADPRLSATRSDELRVRTPLGTRMRLRSKRGHTGLVRLRRAPDDESWGVDLFGSARHLGELAA